MAKRNIEERLAFKEDGGHIDFMYTQRLGDNAYHQTSGTIPHNIIKQGEDAIMAYATQTVEEAKAELKSVQEKRENMLKYALPLKTLYAYGTPLIGRIVEATNRYILVELDDPVKGSSSINFGFASAIRGKHIFAAEDRLSAEGYEAACRALGWAYENAIHKPLSDLVGRLNHRIEKEKKRS